jgi:hypothetical protein
MNNLQLTTMLTAALGEFMMERFGYSFVIIVYLQYVSIKINVICGDSNHLLHVPALLVALFKIPKQ